MRLYIPKGLDFDHVSTEHHIEILVRGVMQNEEGQILFSKRTARATSFPRRWTLPGGKVDIIDILEGKRDDSIGPEKDSLVLNIPLPPGRRYENIFLAFQREMYEEFDVEIVRAHEVLLVDELRHKKIEFSDSSKILYHNRILIVDDSPIFARMFRTVLVAAGFDVTVETDSRRALAAVIAARESDQPFNLIISDKCMPHIDGPTLLADLRRDFRDMKTIITSTSVKSGDAAPFADLAVGKSMDIGTHCKTSEHISRSFNPINGECQQKSNGCDSVCGYYKICR